MSFFFWGAVISASLLITLAILVYIKNYNKVTAKFAAVFFTFGLLGLLFIYFGVYTNTPESDVKGRIKEGLSELKEMKHDLILNKERINNEIEVVYERNTDLIEQFNEIQQNDSTLSYKRALLDPQVSSVLKFLQYNVANIENLKILLKDLEGRSNEIELSTLQLQGELIEWETSGGINGDIDGYMLEEKMVALLANFKSKIRLSENKKTDTKTIQEIWDALNKNTI